MKYLSKITLGLGIFIIVSASFVLQFRNFLAKTLGDEKVRIIFLSLFLLIALLYISYVYYKKLPIYRIALSLIIFGLAYLLILWQPFFGEKLHILEYGVLGFLALKDFAKIDKKIFESIVYALFFVALIGSLDEGFQHVLPYRDFEIRDIVTNVVSGILGIIQYLIYRRVLI